MKHMEILLMLLHRSSSYLKFLVLKSHILLLVKGECHSNLSSPSLVRFLLGIVQGFLKNVLLKTL